MSKNTKVTIAKGGTLERVKQIKDIKVPDLWHIAIALRKNRRVENGPSCADLILDTWNLAHDLHRHIMESP